jgi:hypothetical protein
VPDHLGPKEADVGLLACRQVPSLGLSEPSSPARGEIRKLMPAQVHFRDAVSGHGERVDTEEKWTAKTEDVQR